MSRGQQMSRRELRALVLIALITLGGFVVGQMTMRGCS